MCSTVLLSILTLLCNQLPKLFHTAKLKLCTYSIITPFFLLSPSPGNYHSTFFLINLPTLGNSYKQNHTVLVFLWLTYFTNTVFSKLIFVEACVRMSFSKLNNTPLYVYTTFYLFICQWIFVLVLPLSNCEECCLKNRYANISKILLSVILAIYPVAELLLISC